MIYTREGKTGIGFENNIDHCPEVRRGFCRWQNDFVTPGNPKKKQRIFPAPAFVDLDVKNCFDADCED